MIDLDKVGERVQATFKLDPQVAITLKGKDYILEFNNYAVKGIFKETDFNLMGSAFTLAQMQNPRVMGVMLYYGLKTNHPDITEDEVDKLFTYRHYPYVLSKLRQAIGLFMPDLTDLVSKPEGSGLPEDPTLLPTPAGSDTGQ